MLRANHLEEVPDDGGDNKQKRTRSERDRNPEVPHMFYSERHVSDTRAVEPQVGKFGASRVLLAVQCTRDSGPQFLRN